MDPDANLAEQRRLVADIHKEFDSENPNLDGLAHDASRLAELVQALDEWISGHGALPLQWDKEDQPDAS